MYTQYFRSAAPAGKPAAGMFQHLLKVTVFQFFE